MRLGNIAAVAALATGSVWARCEQNHDNTCVLFPEGGGKDDSPHIVEAFDKCGQDGKIVFTDHEFSVQRVMNTTAVNTDIVLKGRLKWSDDFAYWKSHAYNLWYQNQTTAWILGGENITFVGSGENDGGIFDGNGQAWYTQNNNTANQRGRPIAFTIRNAKNVYAEKLKFLQPQFWAVLVTYSQNVTMKNVLVKAQTNDLKHAKLVNTDGADTWNVKDVTFDGWHVENGDDCIALKGNNTNVVVRNVECVNGSMGLTIGSIGQYAGHDDNIDDVVFEDCKVNNTRQLFYIKSWAGEYQADSSNGAGGGGGAGHVRNVTVRNMQMFNVTKPLVIEPCTYTENGDLSSCETSKIKVDGVRFSNITGISEYNMVTNFRCPAKNPCSDIHLEDIHVETKNVSMGLPNWGVNNTDSIFGCAYIDNMNTTMGGYCNRWAPINWKEGNEQ